jgi:hypothetical protein
LPPPSTIPVVKEVADDEVADSWIAQETSTEDEGYEYIDGDDDVTIRLCSRERTKTMYTRHQNELTILNNRLPSK